MINKEFRKETDKLIKQFKKRRINIYNGNLIVAKVKADEVTAGGLVLPSKANDIKNYNNGLARIIAVADNADPQYKPGLYIVHSHEARYKIYEETLRESLAYMVDADLLYAVQDNAVLFAILEEEMHGES